MCHVAQGLVIHGISVVQQHAHRCVQTRSAGPIGRILYRGLLLDRLLGQLALPTHGKGDRDSTPQAQVNQAVDVSNTKLS
jgi:hypothetical protein